MKKLESSIPGVPFPSSRNRLFPNSFEFLEGRRKDDGAEGLWRIGDSLYDLEPFIKNHPGGSEWLEMTRGTDISEAFEIFHLSENAERMLPKFYVRKAATPKLLPYTFEPNGFYRKFKRRALEALKNVDYHKPSARSKMYADLLLTTAIVFTVITAIFKSWIAAVVAALFICWTGISAHNFFHMRDNFRMYYFDLTLMSSKEWRISHALSHHLYPNTLWDIEIHLLEPFVYYIPTKNKTTFYRIVSIITTPIVFAVVTMHQRILQYFSLFAQWKRIEYRDIMPIIMPLMMLFLSSSLIDGLKFWLGITLLASFIFSFIGLTAGHHHPNIFHDGDICRDNLDWGLMSMDAVRDREVIDDSLFLSLVSFGSHGLHHLLPAIDHDYLKLCVPAYHETCREFGIYSDRYSQWNLITGQYKQILRNTAKQNFRSSPTS